MNRRDTTHRLQSIASRVSKPVRDHYWSKVLYARIMDRAMAHTEPSVLLLQRLLMRGTR